MREAITGAFEDQPALRVTRAVDVAVEVTRVPPLESGDRLTRREVERRVPAMPHF